MAFKKGQSGNPRGKRVGSRNKSTQRFKDLVTKHGFDPLGAMVQLAQGETPCTCKGKVEECPYCNGTGKERVDSSIRARMISELTAYCYPKAKGAHIYASKLADIPLEERLDAIYNAMTKGELTDEEGKALSDITLAQLRALEISEFSEFLNRLKQGEDPKKIAMEIVARAA